MKGESEVISTGVLVADCFDQDFLVRCGCIKSIYSVMEIVAGRGTVSLVLLGRLLSMNR